LGSTGHGFDADAGDRFALGRVGHRASALLTESHLTRAAAAAIRTLLDPGESLADISTWADQQRVIPGSGPWHYVNVPIIESRYDARFCQSGGCVVSKVGDFRQVLLDPSADRNTKQQALKFLVHFLQDMHQPVHVGDNGDRGGNDLQLRFFEIRTNLRRLLDSRVTERYSQDEAQCVRELSALATTGNRRSGRGDRRPTGPLKALKPPRSCVGSQDPTICGSQERSWGTSTLPSLFRLSVSAWLELGCDWRGCSIRFWVAAPPYQNWGHRRSDQVRQTGVLFLHLGELVFVADDDDPAERVWRDEKTALAELESEGWRVTKGAAPIEPDLPGVSEHKIVGYQLERRLQ
jgi:hypothetical protein